MAEALGVAIVTAVVGPAVLLVLGALLNRKINHLSAATQAVKSDTKQTLNQVQNSHTTNLREEGDERHGELVALVTTVLNVQKAQAADIGGIRSELRDLRKDDAGQRDRLLDLEKTQPRPLRRNKE